MDNSDDILAGLTPEQEKEMLKMFETLGKEMEHLARVKELKAILQAREEASKILKQISLGNIENGVYVVRINSADYSFSLPLVVY